MREQEAELRDVEMELAWGDRAGDCGKTEMTRLRETMFHFDLEVEDGCRLD